MRNAVGGFILGIAISAIIALTVLGCMHDAPLSECAQEHNVYACEYVIQPITTED